MKSKISRDVLLVTISFATMALIAFLRRWVIGNYLGAEDLGIFSMFVSIYTILLPIGVIGTYGVVKYVSEFIGRKQSLNSLLTAALVNVVFSSIILLFLLYLLAPAISSVFNMPKLSFAIKLMAFVFPFAILNEFFLSLSNGLRKMKVYSAVTVLITVSQFAVLLALIKLGFGVFGAIASFFMLSLSIPALIYVLRGCAFVPDFQDMKQMLRKINIFGGKVFTSAILTNIYYQADILLLGYFLNTALVGYYSVAIVISRLPWILPDAIQKLTYPLLSEFYGAGTRSTSRYVIAKSIKYTFLAVFSAGIVIIVLSRPIITILFDSTFADAATLPLQILMVGGIFYGSMKALGGAFSSIERVGVEIKIIGACVATNLALNLALIPFFGILGAAVSMLASNILFAALELYFFNKLYSIPFDLRLLLKLGMVCLAVVLAYLLLGPLNPFLLAPILLAIFAVLALVSGFLSKDDIKILKNLVK